MTRISALKQNVLKMTASAIIIGATLVSCTFSGERPASYSAKAEKAAENGKFGKALVLAEAAVAAEPRNAAYRAALAQTYLSNGRFLSAQSSFEDAIELGDVSARNVISLALAQIASGNNGAALSTLSEYRTMIPNGDYGLALSLAGQTRQGVNVLEDEVRTGVNTSKVRQNLALAYALEGRWREARTMAMQDVSPDQVDQRLLTWVQMARPEYYQMRVASILGVTPQADAGQPARLALSNTPAMAELVADIAEPSDSYMAEADPFEMPMSDQVQDKPVQLAMATAAEKDVSVVGLATPLIAATASPMKKTAQSIDIPASSRAMDPAPASQLVPMVEIAKAVSPVRQAPQAGRVTEGDYIVQLGAFSSQSNTKNAWKIYSQRYANLRNFGNASSIVISKGRTLHRLAATGFGNADAAMSLCNDIRAKGGNCIVRQVGNSQPVQAGTRLAARD